MKVRKEIIRPGIYTYIHPKTNLPERLVVTPEKIRHYADQGTLMLAAGLSVPVPIEHQPDAHPMTASERSANLLRNNAGWTEKYEVGEVKGSDGITVKDVLFGTFNIHDADIAKKLPHTIKFTSPWITSFVDGTGKKWSEVISHNALTTRPRITSQQPFAVDMAAALSLVGQLSEKPVGTAAAASIDGGVGLSLAGLLWKDQKTGQFVPANPMAFSLMTGVRLSKEDIASREVKDDEEFDAEAAGGEGGGEGGDDGEKSASDVKKPAGRESPLDNVDAADDMNVAANDVTIHEMIGHLLKALGFSPPDGMSEETFERDLYETLMAKVQEIGAKQTADAANTAADANNQDKQQDANNQQPGNNPGPVIQESPAMYASLEEVAKIQDPKERKMAGMLFSLAQEATKNKTRADAIGKNILQAANTNRQKKVDKLARRLPVAHRDALLSMMAEPSAQLSLGDDGTVVDPMGRTLAILDAGIVQLATDAPVHEMPNPQSGPGMDANRQKAVMDELLKNTGGVPMGGAPQTVAAAS